MGKTLVLAEKPLQARDYAAALGSFRRADGYLENDHYVITWATGHLLELCEPDEYDPAFKAWRWETLPIVPAQFRLRPRKKNGKNDSRTLAQIQVLKTQFNRPDVDRVVIATDAEREGELIARELLEHLGCHKPLLRFWTSQALSPKVVRDTMAALRPASDYDRVHHEARARQRSDWIIGIAGTRAWTLAANRRNDVWSVGRVQTPTLALVVRRRKEIDAFVPEHYLVLEADFAAPTGPYRGTYIGPDAADGEDPPKEGRRIADPAQAQAIVAQIRAAGMTGEVGSVDVEKKREPPPLLYSTTTLSRDANKKLGFTAAKTLKVAQALYEERKAITYPRTECEHLGTKIAPDVAHLLDQCQHLGLVAFDRARCTVNPASKRVFDDSKLTDHHAIIPSGQVVGTLAPDERNLLELVVRRFAAAFYPNHEYEATRVVTTTGGHRFRTVGRVTLVEGWKALYPPAAPSPKKGRGRTPSEEASATDDADVKLPALARATAVRVTDLRTLQRQTKPPSLYTDATLIDDMKSAAKFVTNPKLAKVLRDSAGIGTPVTRPNIIETLIGRSYIERQGKSLDATAKGVALIDAMEGEQIVDPAYSAAWEAYLQDIGLGHGGANEGVFLEKTVDYARRLVEAARKRAPALAQSTAQTPHPDAVGPCPACGSPVREMPKSYACTAYRTTGCRFALWKNELERLGKKAIPPSVAKALLQGKTIRLKGLVGKSQKPFDAGGRLTQGERGWRIELVFDSAPQAPRARQDASRPDPPRQDPPGHRRTPPG